MKMDLVKKFILLLLIMIAIALVYFYRIDKMNVAPESDMLADNQAEILLEE